MTEVGRIVSPENRAVFVEFITVTDCEKDRITLQEGETMAWRWVTRKELLCMKKDELATERMQGFVGELAVSNARNDEAD